MKNTATPTMTELLYNIELVKKTGSNYFTHNGINMELNAEVISIGLKVNVRDYFINGYGLTEGIDRAYHILKSMYAENTGEAGLSDSLTDWGRDLLNTLLTDACEELKANDSETFH